MSKNPVPVTPLGRLLLLLAVSAMPMAVAFAARSDSNAKNQKKDDRRLETWRVAINLEASKQLPSAVQWAIHDNDPVPAFKARIKRFGSIFQEQLKEAQNQAAREEKRNKWISMQWDWGFKEIPGDRLYLLTPDNPHPFESNAQDGKKWIVTKVRMMKGKPVCWSIPVEVKYGEEIKVTLTEKNVFDLGTAAESALREAATSPEDKKLEEWRLKTWRVQLALRFPGAAPFEAAYAIFDEDPLPAFKAAVKKWQANRKEKGPVKGEERQAAMTVSWDEGFKKIPGNRLYQLRSSRLASVASNAPDGKKWIVTKVVEIKGKPVCWYLPVEVKTGKELVKVTLTADNAFDLGAAFDSALGKSESKK
jgi:hypothetical protein